MKIFSKLKKYGIFVLLILLIIIFTAVSPAFLSVNNLINLSKQIAITCILCVGMTFVLLTGGIDLSVGSIVSLLCVVISLFVTKFNIPAIIAMLMGLIIALMIGFINGVIIAKIKVPALIITLGMQIFISGFTFTICGGLPVYGIPNSLKYISQTQIFGFLPLSALLMLAILLIGSFLLSKTYIGRYFYAVGSNEKTSILAGINTDKVRILAFSLSGIIAGLAGIVMLSRVGSGQPAAGDGYEMDALTACVLGGVSLDGGKGNINNAFIGALVIGVLSNGMYMAGLGAFEQKMVKGLVLIAAVVLDSVQNMKTRKQVIN